jgi:ATP-dependent helicase Lhr and Lhr-like helicase
MPSLDGQTSLQNTLGLLDGITAAAGSWEADLYPARVADYDPAWLDQMCVSGKIVWGRYSIPNAAQQPQRGKVASRGSSSGPIRSTPISIVTRANLDIFKALFSAHQREREEMPRSELAKRIESDLEKNGASFFDQIQRRTGLLKFQLEQGLAELVSTARISSDSFTGLRALLTPTKKKPSVHSRRGRRVMFSVEDAGRWSLLDTNKSDNSLVTNSRHWDVLDADQLERLVAIYLQRWGVLFRGLLERESFAPPWRVLLTALRKLELRGTIRGGRFVETVGGEQFAFPEIVDALRKFKKSEQSGKNKYYSLSAVDPLNLMNLILPNQKLSRLSKHRVLYENGIPIALLDSGKVSFLKQVDAAKEWNLRQALIKKHFPPRLSSYLGIH